MYSYTTAFKTNSTTKPNDRWMLLTLTELLPEIVASH
jgi:hypothetical protein